MNVNILFPNDISLQEKNKEKIQKFDINTEKSDLCHYIRWRWMLFMG